MSAWVEVSADIADCCSHFDIGRHNNKRQVAYTEAEADPPIVVATVATLPSEVSVGAWAGIKFRLGL